MDTPQILIGNETAHVKSTTNKFAVYTKTSSKKQTHTHVLKEFDSSLDQNNNNNNKKKILKYYQHI